MSAKTFVVEFKSWNDFFEHQKRIDQTYTYIQEKYGLKKHELLFLLKLLERKELHLKEAIEQGYIQQNKAARSIKSLCERKYIEKNRLKSDERAVILKINNNFKDEFEDISKDFLLTLNTQ